MSMWWRFLIPLSVGLLMVLGFGMLAGDGDLGRYGWSIAMIIGAVVAGIAAGLCAPPRKSSVSDRRPRDSGKSSISRG